jgi:hypothetical protein
MDKEQDKIKLTQQNKINNNNNNNNISVHSYFIGTTCLLIPDCQGCSPISINYVNIIYNYFALLNHLHSTCLNIYLDL